MSISLENIHDSVIIINGVEKRSSCESCKYSEEYHMECAFNAIPNSGRCNTLREERMISNDRRNI